GVGESVHRTFSTLDRRWLPHPRRTGSIPGIDEVVTADRRQLHTARRTIRHRAAMEAMAERPRQRERSAPSEFLRSEVDHCGCPRPSADRIDCAADSALRSFLPKPGNAPAPTAASCASSKLLMSMHAGG